MALPPWLSKRDSLAKGPDYSAKQDALAYLRKDKITYKEAEYAEAGRDSKRRCSECSYYKQVGQPESDCAKVIGMVKAEGVCNLWEQRDYAQDDAGKTITIEIRTN